MILAPSPAPCGYGLVKRCGPGRRSRRPGPWRELRCDRRRVDVLVETTRTVEARRERTRAGTARLRIAGDVGSVVVTSRVGRANRVALIRPGRSNCGANRRDGDVVAEERNESAPELLVVEVRRSISNMDADRTGLPAVGRIVVEK